MERSCIDCGLQGCGRPDGNHPSFCPALDFDLQNEPWLQEQFEEPENRHIIEAAAVSVSHAFGEKLSRIDETVWFAQSMGAKKIGIAACISLRREAREAARILRERGFEVVGAICKIGTVTHSDVGLEIEGKSPSTVLCNPMFQAKLLNDEHVDLNVVMGLCVGHDTLFLKHAQAPCTVLAVKDFKYDNHSVLGLRP